MEPWVRTLSAGMKMLLQRFMVKKELTLWSVSTFQTSPVVVRFGSGLKEPDLGSKQLHELQVWTSSALEMRGGSLSNGKICFSSHSKVSGEEVQMSDYILGEEPELSAGPIDPFWSGTTWGSFRRNCSRSLRRGSSGVF